MHFKPLPVEIPEDDPFQNDKLKRKKYVEALSLFVGKVSAPFVLSINSPWGSGKTTLIEMWRKELAKSDYVTIYFNAWETDFSTSPMVSFVGEVTKSLKELPGDQDKIDKILSKAKSITTSVVRHGVPALAKAATLGVLDIDAAIEKVAADVAGDATKDLVQAYLDDKKKIEEFHEVLEEAFSWAIESGKKSPMIIFIDELDRCRPSYAIELLENIKHLFNTKNAIFILGIDKSQLNVSLQSVYGQGINSDEYLRRFIDFEFVLPAPNNRDFVIASMIRLGLEEYFNTRLPQLKDENNQLVDTLVECFDLFELTPRAREHCLSRIAVVALSTPHDHYFYPDLTAILVTLRIASSSSANIFHKYVYEDLPASEVTSYIASLPKGKKFLESRAGAWIEGILIGAKAKGHSESNEHIKYQEILKSDKTTNQEKERAQLVLDASKDALAGNPKFGRIKLLGQRIELVSTD